MLSEINYKFLENSNILNAFTINYAANITNFELSDVIQDTLWSSTSASGTNQGAIDNRIEQAMDLVKSHLMNAVRSEVEELKEKIIKLEETISQQQMEISKQHNDFTREVGKLQAENEFLKSQVPPEVLVQLSNIQPQQQQQQPQQQQQQQYQ